MNKFRFTINVLAIAIFVFALASMAQAQATRTWVSGVGDDANPCSRTAPCKTFAGAISKTAQDGEIDALDPGGFGALTITKSITINGNGWGSILVAGTNGINVNVSTTGINNAVQIQNLSINGVGTGINGISITAGAGTSVFVENCVIFGFNAAGGRGISDTRSSGTGQLFVKDTIVKFNNNQGILVQGAATIKSTLDHVEVWANGIGILNSGGNNFMVIRNSVVSKNTNAGIAADTGSRMDIVDSLSSHNGTGINSDSAADVVCARTNVTRNTVNGLGFSGGTIKSYGNCEVFGNVGNNGPFSAASPTLQ